MILNRFTNYGCQYEYGYVAKLRPVGNGDMERPLGERWRANQIICLTFGLKLFGAIFNITIDAAKSRADCEDKQMRIDPVKSQEENSRLTSVRN